MRSASPRPRRRNARCCCPRCSTPRRTGSTRGRRPSPRGASPGSGRTVCRRHPRRVRLRPRTSRSSPGRARRPPGRLAGTGFRRSRDGGYVHAPSLAHAATAGVLRNARLTHDPPTPAAPRSTSICPARGPKRAPHRRRHSGGPAARRAARLPLRTLAARAVERRLALDRYIYVLRSIAPLAAGKLTDSTGPSPRLVALESVPRPTSSTGSAFSSRRRRTSTATIARASSTGRTPPAGTSTTGRGSEDDRRGPCRDKRARAGPRRGRRPAARRGRSPARPGQHGRAAAALDAAGGGDGVPPDPMSYAPPGAARRSRIATRLSRHRLVRRPPAGAPTHHGPSPTPDSKRGRGRSWVPPRGSCFPSTGAARLTLADLDLCALDLSRTPARRCSSRAADSGPSAAAFAPLTVRPAAWGGGRSSSLLAEAEELARSLRDLLGTRVRSRARRSLSRMTQQTRLARWSSTSSRDARRPRETASSRRERSSPTRWRPAGHRRRLAALYAWGVRPPAPARVLRSGRPRGSAPPSCSSRNAVSSRRTPRWSRRTAGTAPPIGAAAAATAPTEPRPPRRSLGDSHGRPSAGRALGRLRPGPAGVAGRPPARGGRRADGGARGGSPDDGADVRPWLSRWASVRQGVARHAETSLVP